MPHNSNSKRHDSARKRCLATVTQELVRVTKVPSGGRFSRGTKGFELMGAQSGQVYRAVDLQCKGSAHGRTWGPAPHVYSLLASLNGAMAPRNPLLGGHLNEVRQPGEHGRDAHVAFGSIMSACCWMPRLGSEPNPRRGRLRV